MQQGETMDSGMQVDRALGYFEEKNFAAANAAVALVLHADSRNLRALRLLADLRSAQGQKALGRRLHRWADEIEKRRPLPLETNGSAVDADADYFEASAEADTFDPDEHDPIVDGSAAYGTSSTQQTTLSATQSQSTDEDPADPDLAFFASSATADVFDPDELDPVEEERAPTPTPRPRPLPRQRMELRLYAEEKALNILMQTGRLNGTDAELDHVGVLADIMLNRASWSDEPFRSIAAQTRHMRDLLDRNINVSNLPAAHNCRMAWHVNTHFHVDVAQFSIGWHSAVGLSWLDALRFAELFKVSEMADAEHALQGIYDRWRCSRLLQREFPMFRRYVVYRLQDAGWFLDMVPDQVFAEPEDAHWIETWEDDPVRRPLLAQYMDLRGMHNDDPYWD